MYLMYLLLSLLPKGRPQPPAILLKTLHGPQIHRSLGAGGGFGGLLTHFSTLGYVGKEFKCFVYTCCVKNSLTGILFRAGVTVCGLLVTRLHSRR